MGLVFWALAAGAGMAGYCVYRQLQVMEKEIRREVAGEGPPEGEAEAGAMAAEKLEGQVMQRVKERPGILQTELYALFPDENRRTLQELLKNMDREGVLTRTRERGTYRLAPGK